MHLYTSRVSTRLYRIAQGVHSMVDQVCSGYTRRLTSRRHVYFNVFESIAFPSVTAYERESNSPVPDDVDLDILGVLQSSASNTMCFWIVEKIAFIDCFADCYDIQTVFLKKTYRTSHRVFAFRATKVDLFRWFLPRRPRLCTVSQVRCHKTKIKLNRWWKWLGFQREESRSAARHVASTFLNVSPKNQIVF